MDKIDLNDRWYATVFSELTLQSDKNGFFLQFADKVINYAGSGWLEEKFAKLTNDRQRIESLLNDEHVKEIVCDTLANVECVYREKNARIAKEKREDAEVYVKTGILPKALMLYSQSVLRAPPKGVDILVDAGRTLSLAYWGRSQVLAQLGEVSAALNDIQLALKEGLPDSFRPELYIRMGVYYDALGESNRARVSLALAEKLFGKSKALFEKCKSSIKLKQVPKKASRKYLPKVTEEVSSENGVASSLIELKESADMGRYFVAKKPISTGDILVVEEPRAACLLVKNFGSHCQHCFERLLAPVGCRDCASLAFCSTECRDKAMDTYHKYECKILDMLIGSGMSVVCNIALRMVTQEGLEKCLAICNDKSLDRAQNLCTHAEQREAKDFLRRTLMALFLLRCLQLTDFFPNTSAKTDEADQSIVFTNEEIQIAELLLFNLQVIQFNAHEIYETKHVLEHRFRYSKTGCAGAGLFTTVCLFNHDCYPGVLRYFVDKNIVIRANRPFKPGDMIGENYGPVFLMKNLAERQRTLSSRYWFNCQCTACKENWPGLDKLQNRHARLKCTSSNCNYLFSQKVNDPICCPECKKRITLKSSRKKLLYCEEQYKICFNLVDTQEPEKAVPILISAINLFHSIAAPPHRETHLAQEALRSCLADTGNCYQCLVKNPV